MWYQNEEVVDILKAQKFREIYSLAYNTVYDISKVKAYKVDFGIWPFKREIEVVDASVTKLYAIEMDLKLSRLLIEYNRIDSGFYWISGLVEIDREEYNFYKKNRSNLDSLLYVIDKIRDASYKYGMLCSPIDTVELAKQTIENIKNHI